MTLETSTGIIIIGVLFFLIYFANSLKGEDWFHKVIRLFIFIVCLWIPVIASGAAIEYARSNEICETAINYTEETYVYGDNYSGYHFDHYGGDASPSLNDLNLFHKNTTYFYTTHCYNANNTSDSVISILQSLYNLTLYFAWVLTGLILLYFLYSILSALKIKKENEKEKMMGGE